MALPSRNASVKGQQNVSGKNMELSKLSLCAAKQKAS
jgi:hypothetical protein